MSFEPLSDDAGVMRAVLASLAAVVLAIVAVVALAGCADAGCLPSCATDETCRVTTTRANNGDCQRDSQCIAPPEAGDQCGFAESNPNADCFVGFDVACAAGLACVESTAGDCPHGVTNGDGHVSCCVATTGR